ncbi:MAG: DUF488 family protein [Aminobacterium sp.]|uniref:DUF488 domain-containing protein n=1 Tax=Aminobacterium sp. MB27-C1 TaxID=3070661 RepID=UPI001BCFA0E9|nr:DUF488 family protein [Aminobacterium sp. MB27-C1]MDD3427044.1 DUF488 family protein [Aminobacterium sp.]WMI72201.1 DUF488 family protein [Aminobacterium sp. MB27-C1]
MPITLKRIYEEADSSDGYRILVDRLWPRGLSKEKAKVDEWMKEVAPSNELRKLFHGGELAWAEFEKQYREELETHLGELRTLAERAKTLKVTLLYSSKNSEQNNATVLKEYLESMNGE